MPNVTTTYQLWLPRRERRHRDDPRAPIAERYPTHDAYATRGRAVVSELQRERLLLVEDADGYLKRDRE